MEKPVKPIQTSADDEARSEELFELLRGFTGSPEDLIPMLQASQRILGYLPRRVLLEIAALTGLPPARVFGVATFYAQFRLQPKGAHMVRVCRGTACHVRGSRHICSQLQRRFQIVPGETTPDRRFTLETVACFGSCALAPVVVVDENVHGRMSPGKALGVVDELTPATATPVEETLEAPP